MPEQAAPVAGDDLIAKAGEWYALKAQIAELAAREGELRREIFAAAFPDAGEKGTYRIDVGHGKDLKGTAKLNYTVDKTKLDEALDKLPAHVADRVIRYKPEVVEAELLRVTNTEHKELLASFITSKPGTPALEIVDQKKQR